MASYTGLSEKRVNTHRSGFDISQKNAFTAKVGELLPVYWDISMPGDVYRINTQYFTRTQPVQTSAYTRLREYFDWYAVPLRLLWKSAPIVVTQMQGKESVQALSMTQNLQLGIFFPSVRLQDISSAIIAINGSANPVEHGSRTPVQYQNFFGYNRADLSAKLLHYLHYGNFIQPSVGASSVKMFGSSVLQGVGDMDDRYKQDVVVNLFPLLAYQKIYQDFFRWSQWENANPSTWNVDYFDGSAPYMTLPEAGNEYWDSKGMFDLQYCNWNKDLFMGILPNSQYGDVSVIDVGSSSAVGELPFPDYPENGVYVNSNTAAAGEDFVKLGLTIRATGVNGAIIPAGSYKVYEPAVRNDNRVDVSVSDSSVSRNVFANVRKSVSDLSSQFTVLALRQAEALQHWKEVIQSTDTDYRSQMEAQFGVKLPAALSNVAIYIGGMARNLDISEVLNQNLDTQDSTAFIKGKGVGTGQDGFTYNAKEPSVIMCLYHALPLLDYDLTGPDSQLLITDVESYPQPAFDSIGMETLPSVLLNNTYNSYSAEAPDMDGDSSQLLYMGYVPRYYHHKTKVDLISGAFVTTLKSWVAPLNTYSYWNSLAGNSGGEVGSFFTVDYRFFKVNPSILDSIFGVEADSTWDTDQLLINCYNQVYVARNLSRDGLPY